MSQKTSFFLSSLTRTKERQIVISVGVSLVQAKINQHLLLNDGELTRRLLEEENESLPAPYCGCWPSYSLSAQRSPSIKRISQRGMMKYQIINIQHFRGARLCMPHVSCFVERGTASSSQSVSPSIHQQQVWVTRREMVWEWKDHWRWGWLHPYLCFIGWTGYYCGRITGGR